MRWSSHSVGPAILHNAVAGLIRMGGLRVARLLLCFIALYYALSPGIAGRCRPYLRRRFPDSGLAMDLGRRYRICHAFASVLFARMVAGVLDRTPDVIDAHMGDAVGAALSEGRGCLILGAHVGAWQTGLAGLERFGRRITILQFRDDGDVDRHYFERARGHGIDVVNSREGVPAAIAIAAALRRGEIVCLMGDRITDAEPIRIEQPFLGGRIVMPGSPYAVAAVTGAPLIACFSVPEGDAVRIVTAHRISVPRASRLDSETLRPCAEEFRRCLEDFLDAHPFLFFNFYDMWETHDDQG